MRSRQLSIIEFRKNHANPYTHSKVMPKKLLKTRANLSTRFPRWARELWRENADWYRMIRAATSCACVPKRKDGYTGRITHYSSRINVQVTCRLLVGYKIRDFFFLARSNEWRVQSIRIDWTRHSLLIRNKCVLLRIWKKCNRKMQSSSMGSRMQQTTFDQVSKKYKD